MGYWFSAGNDSKTFEKTETGQKTHSSVSSSLRRPFRKHKNQQRCYATASADIRFPPFQGASCSVFCFSDIVLNRSVSFYVSKRVNFDSEFQEEDIPGIIKKLGDHFQQQNESAVRVKILSIFRSIGRMPGADPTVWRQKFAFRCVWFKRRRNFAVKINRWLFNFSVAHREDDTDDTERDVAQSYSPRINHIDGHLAEFGETGRPPASYDLQHRQTCKNVTISRNFGPIKWCMIFTSCLIQKCSFIRVDEFVTYIR